MIFVPKIIRPSRFGQPKFQRGILHPVGFWGTVLGPPVVSVAALKLVSKSVVLGTCYAGVQVDADGDLYEVGADLFELTQYETWLDSGLNSQVWILASPVSGTWSTSPSALSTRLICTSDRKWTISNNGSGTANGELDLQFYDAPSGGSLLDTQTVTASATDT